MSLFTILSWASLKAPTRRFATWRQGVLLASMAGLSVLAGLAIVPVLPQMERQFASTPGLALLLPLLLMLPTLMMGLACGPAGLLADRLGRKKVLVWGLLVYAAAGVAPFALGSLYLIAVTRVILGFSTSAIMTASTVMIGDLFEPKDRGRWLTVQAVAAGAGAVIIFAISGALGEFGWRLPFLEHGVALLFALMAVFSLWEKDSSYHPSEDRRLLEAPHDGSGRKHLSSIRFFWFCMLSAFAGANIIYMAVQSPYILADRNIHSPSLIGSAGAFLALASVTGSIAAGLGESVGLTPRLIIGFGFMAAGYAVAAQSSHFVGVTLGMCLHGFGGGVLLPTLARWVLSQLPRDKLGRGTGMWQSCLFGGQFLSPFYALGLADLAGGLSAALNCASIGAAVIALLAVAVWLGSLERAKERKLL